VAQRHHEQIIPTGAITKDTRDRAGFNNQLGRDAQLGRAPLETFTNLLNLSFVPYFIRGRDMEATDLATLSFRDDKRLFQSNPALVLAIQGDQNLRK
jgi:hypothetical protein